MLIVTIVTNVTIAAIVTIVTIVTIACNHCSHVTIVAMSPLHITIRGRRLKDTLLSSHSSQKWLSPGRKFLAAPSSVDPDVELARGRWRWLQAQSERPHLCTC